jgi:hypothetical protein
MGDAELDVALFVSSLDSQCSHRAPVEVALKSLYSGYESMAGILYPRLLLAYETQQQLTKAVRRAWAVRPDSDVRVERQLIKAWCHVEDTVGSMPMVNRSIVEAD